MGGRERAYVQSKYVEDQVPGNHSSIWGSWYDTTANRWGFACCHQTMKNAYCVALKKHDAVEEAPDGEGEAGDDAEGGSSSSDSDDSSSSDDDANDGEENADAENKKERLAEKRKARALAGLQLMGKAGE